MPQPINADGSSVFSAKSTSPAKFRVRDAKWTLDRYARRGVEFRARPVTTVVREDVDSTTPDSNFRWDPTAQHWTFNVSNKGLHGPNRTYYFGIQLNDGSAILSITA